MRYLREDLGIFKLTPDETGDRLHRRFRKHHPDLREAEIARAVRRHQRRREALKMASFDNE